MTQQTISEHWGRDDIYSVITATLAQMGKSLDTVTVEDLAPVDHVHARGFAATVELADRLPVKAGQELLDIGCGLGGPARYLAQRFQCRVVGIDITPPFVEAARKLTTLLRLGDRVRIDLGDGERLPYPDGTFDGAYALHVTMNVADRPRFFGEAWRALRPGAFFALTEHGLGPAGQPHYPVPWSEDGAGSHLVTPAATRALLEAAGFESVTIEETGPEYLAGYRAMIERAEKGQLPPLGIHLILGETALAKARNAARNIAEGRTHPISVLCRKRG